MEEGWKLQYIGQVNTQVQIKRLCPQIPYSQFEDDLKKIGTIFYQLQIKRGCQSWTVLKNRDQVNEFCREYEEKFHRCITFKEFFKQGLEILSNHQKIQENQFFQEFFQLNYLEYRKFKSLKMLKKCGGRYIEKCFCQSNWLSWKLRDFVITADGVLYCHHNHKNLKEFISFGKSFKIKQFPDIPHLYGILLLSNHRKLLIQAQNIRGYFTFLYYLNKAKNVAYQNIRYDSFAPIRKRNNVNFYIDGQGYFKDIAKAIQKAQQQIFICGWWVSPQFQLIRPYKQNYIYRLDRLLQSVAQKGIRIYILVYWESTFLTNSSEYTKIALEKLHQNIKVIRHPDIILPSFWSHHQKMVIIDQHQCFMGGLDICYGRYDNQDHCISENSENFYPGIQYNNTRITDFKDVKNYKISDIPRNKPRLPWHDIALNVKGQCVKDFSHHFIEYWNFASYQVHKLERQVLISRTSKSIEHQSQNIKPSKKQKVKNFLKGQIEKVNNFFKQKFRPKQVKQDDNRVEDMLDTSKPIHKEQIHKNYNVHEDELDLQLKRYSSSKQLKQKISQKELNIFCINNKPALRFTIAKKQHSPQQNKKVTENNIVKDKNEKSQNKNAEINSQGQPEFYNFSDNSQSGQYISQIYEAGSLINFDENENEETCQALRSVSHWSIGCKETSIEKSIAEAYIDTILTANFFIYIENQFFISSVEGEQVIKNKVVQAIIQRISQAIKKKEKFKVFVIMPLIPGFAGQLYDSSASLPRVIMNWQYRTICRHKNSLMEKIKQLTPHPQNYLQFFGLRTHGIVQNNPHTQIIYVHSKLLIVDDKKLIMGSANINDRSMEGDRDSQICLLIEKGEQITKMINNKKTLVNKKIHEMRVKLWNEHFGLDKIECEDPLNQKTQYKITQNVQENTEIYREVFRCYPDDSIKKVRDILPFMKKQVDKEKYQNLKNHIQGHAVEFPLHFLQNQDLSSMHPDIIST